ncbi:MAG: CarD family transcriptional regulator, partial [bacterium]
MKKYYSNTNPGLLAEWTTAGERPFLCIVPTRSRAETLQVNLDVLHAGEAELLPGWDITPGKTTFPEQNLQYRRLKALNRLQQTGLRGLVMPVNALGIPVLNPGNLPVLNLNSGQQIPPKQVIRKLETLGYSRQSLVQQQGDYALRGDLLDFYPDNHQFPLRISFFDREIETIEYFHPSTQMKADKQPKLPLKLTLRSEFALAPEEREKLQDKLLAAGFRDQANILEYSRQPEGLPGWFGLWPRKIVNPEDLLENPRIAVYKPEKCLEEIEEWEEELGNLNQKDPRQKTFRSIEKVLEDIDETRSPRYFFNFYQQTSLTPPGGEEKYGEPININPSASLEPRPIEDFIQIISELTEDCQIIRIHCSEESFRGRLRELLVEQLGSAENINNCELELIASPWRGSYRFGDEARVSLDDFFNRTISRGKIGGLSGKTEYLASFEELNPGDLVVHEDFGIGRFKGLKRVETEKQVRDCLLVEYEGQDRLYLPPDQAARIQKYLADSGFTPSLSSLDSSRWSRVKSRVKEDVNELAEELLELYMDREDSEAEPYPPDSLAQTQFEASFPYRETPDQQQSIKQVK